MTIIVPAGVRADWQRDAACVDADPRLFDAPPTPQSQAYCGRCRVRGECVAVAIAEELDGASGGLSTQERNRLREQGWTLGMPLPPITASPSRPGSAQAGQSAAPRPAATSRRAPAPSPTTTPGNGRASTGQPTPQARPLLRPRPHQQHAIDDCAQGFATGARGQLCMPCGTGKTLVPRWQAERLNARLTVVLVPTLALVEQTLRAWRAAGGWPFAALVVCSDPTTAAGAAERGGRDDAVDPFTGAAIPAWARHRVQVTSDPAAVAAFITGQPPDAPRVVFATYHSSGLVGRGVRAADWRADLVVCDEAHRLAGLPRAEFRTALHDSALPAARRLFMTATPTLGDASPHGRKAPAPLSMSDERLFGPTWHKLAFGDAVNQRLLVDYEVLVIGDDAQPGPGRPGRLRLPNEVAAVGALRAAAVQHRLRRVLTFHGRVDKAAAFAAALDGTRLADGRIIRATHVSGTQRTLERQRALRRLDRAQPGELVVVANARCLAEGVDVPAVDAVCFADPRHSQVDIVQAVGRALRRAPGKQRGLVIIPIDVPAGGDDDSALAASRFAGVWTVLQALRAADERFADEIDRVGRAAARHGDPGRCRTVAKQVRFSLPERVEVDAVRVRLVRQLGDRWEHYFGLLEAYVDTHGHARVPAGYRAPSGEYLGRWVQQQRRAAQRRVLAAARAARLARLPGWVWDLRAACWRDELARMHKIVLQQIPPGQTPDIDELADVPLPSGSSRGSARLWAAAQRIDWRAGRLADWQVRGIEEALPGWRWTVLPAADCAMVDALARHVARTGDANVPAGHLEGGLPLGDWLQGVLRRRAADRLPAALADELAIVTPSATRPGALRWQRNEMRWLLGYEALCQFAAREGHSRVPAGHVEVLPDGVEVALGRWTAAQHSARQHGSLDAEQTRQLEQQPGWTWAQTDTTSPRLVHGRRSTYNSGCHCTPCTAAHRGYSQQRRERQAAADATGLVDPARAQAHLRQLVDAGASRRAIARAAGVDRRVVAEALAGGRQLQRAVEARLLAVTPTAVHAAAGPRSRVDAAPTWRLLDDLVARGWPKGWLARELGLGRALTLARDRVTVVNAARVAALHQRIGARRPPLDSRTPPQLAELEAREAAAKGQGCLRDAEVLA